MRFLRHFEVATAAACLVMMMAGAISAGHLETRLRGSRVARMLSESPEASPGRKLRGSRGVHLVKPELHHAITEDILEVVAPSDELKDLNKRTHDVWVAYKKGDLTAEEAHAKLLCLKKQYSQLIDGNATENKLMVQKAYTHLILKIQELETHILEVPEVDDCRDGCHKGEHVTLPEIDIDFPFEKPSHNHHDCNNAESEIHAYVTRAKNILKAHLDAVMTKEEAFHAIQALRGALVSHTSACLQEPHVQAALNKALTALFHLESKLDYVIDHVPTLEEVIATVEIQAVEIWEAYDAAKMTVNEAIAATRQLRQELVMKTRAVGAHAAQHVEAAVQAALVKLINLEVRIRQAAQVAIDHVDIAVDHVVDGAHATVDHVVDGAHATVDHVVDGAHVAVENAQNTVDHVVDETADLVHGAGETAVDAVDTTVAHVRLAKDALLRSISEAIDYVMTATHVTVEQVNQHIAAKKEALIGAVELTREQTEKIEAHLAHLLQHVADDANEMIVKKEMLLRFLHGLSAKVHAHHGRFLSLQELKLCTEQVHADLAHDAAVLVCYKRRELERHLEELKAKCAKIAPHLSEHEWCQEEVQTCQQQMEEVPPCQVTADPLPNLGTHGKNIQHLLEKLHSSWFGKVNHVEALVSELEHNGTPEDAIVAVLEALNRAAN